jgi:predicted  nucleic acid-binding Zn-ribbon protein
MTTQELTTAMRGVEKTISTHDECIKDNKRRLDSIESEVKEQGKLLNTIDKLVAGLARFDEKITDLSDKIDGLGSRINLIELKPAEKWERIIFEILKYVVLAGVGFLAAKLLGK